MAITKKLRFEVFKRDNFQCKYCGNKPPEVVLEVDHIVPKSKGGQDDIANLVTACFDCNRGKSNRKLKDKICREDIDYSLEIEKMKQKKEQLNEYYKWIKKTKLSILENPEIKAINDYLSETFKWSLSEYGAKSIYIYFLKENKLSISDIYDAIDITQFKMLDTPKSQSKYLIGVLWNKVRAKENE